MLIDANNSNFLIKSFSVSHADFLWGKNYVFALYFIPCHLNVTGCWDWHRRQEHPRFIVNAEAHYNQAPGISRYDQCSGLSWESCQSWSEFWEIQTLICKEMCKKFLVLTKSFRSQTNGPALVSNTGYDIDLVCLELEQLERLHSEDTPNPSLPPHDYPYYWVILDPKSTEDNVKVINLKNLPKLQSF